MGRLGQRCLRCGACGRTASRVAPTRRPVRRWRDLAMREHIVELVYAPYRVWCAHCGLRVERIRLSALLQLNSPIVKAYLLKEDLRRFWDYRSTAWGLSAGMQ